MSGHASPRCPLVPLYGLLLLLPTLTGCPDDEGDDDASVNPPGTLEPSPTAPAGPDIEVAPAALEFGDVTLGSDETLTLTVSNHGGADLEVTSLTLVPSQSVWSLSGSEAPFTVAPGGTTSIDVRFAPDEEGPFTGTLSVGSNDPDSGMIDVPLSGDGVVDPDDSDDDDDGYSENQGDCDDDDPTTYPEAEERCDGVDNDCDGDVDEDNDADGDGTPDCDDDDGDGASENDGDCNDQNPDQSPTEPEQCNGIDDNCDGSVDEGADFDDDGDGYTLCGGDCDDTDPEVNPDATETCNGADDNCNGEDDEGLPVETYYQDADGDGYGDAGQSTASCSAPAGYVADGTDCDDANASVNPGAAEVCNGADDDCDLQVDEDVATQSWYEDADGDGYGDVDQTASACAPPAGYVAEGTDCDDANAAIHPDATETCNLVDDDCDGVVDDDVTTSTWYRDADNDGYGDNGTTTDACSQPAGYVTDDTDCDDTREDVNPGAPEQCNGVDDNCNGAVDEDISTSTWYQDGDGDGFGNPDRSTVNCARPNGYVSNADDCDDANAAINPAATEVCNGIDDDCDDQVDEGVLSSWYVDADGDGYGAEGSAPVQACAAPSGYVGNAGDCNDAKASINPAATETCNQIDDDCNGIVDDGLATFVYFKDADGDGYGDPNTTQTSCSRPAGYVSDGTDCNDKDASINPGAAEKCDGIDQNCNGQVDDGVATQLWYRDADGDTYGDAATSTSSCAQPAGYTDDALDCNDRDSSINPAATEVCDGVDNDCDAQIDEGVKTTWYQDSDGDGYGNAAVTKEACSKPTGYVADKTDCDDTKASVHPGATETCNLIDDDCDGQVDEGVATTTWYQDADGDGYGNPNVTKVACSQPTGYVSNKTDCNDTKASINPGATEQCNQIDDNCNGIVDDGVATSTWYRDADGDGYGNASQSTTACAQPTGYVLDKTDCDDTKASVNPGATEKCNGIDDDCDSQIDEGVKTTYYQDADSDTWGNSSVTQQACSQPTGYTTRGGDCNDNNASINPGAAETCNGIDDDCDSQIDEGVATSTWYQDADGDGYGNPNVTKVACSKPTGYVSNKTDCDDTKASVNPGATETCNGVDDDCDGVIDDGVTTYTWYQDSDGDTYGNSSVTRVSCSQPTGYVSRGGDCDDTKASVNPGATETCNGIDDDCDSQIDENVKTTYYQDADGDGYGNASVTQQACSKPTGYVTDKTDCNDADASIHPGATETCNAKDDDCDGSIDEGVATSTWYQDADGDGYGNASVTKVACSKPTGYVSDKTDCDDTKASVNPGATEQCNGVDDDCDGVVDDGVATSTWYQDSDNDGYGGSVTKTACSQPTGYVSRGGDCNDNNAAINPGAAEVCNGVDDDCDSQIDENVKTTWYQDADGDGYGNANVSQQACSKPTGYVTDKTDCDDTKASVNPGATEVCDGLDNDCDTQIDENVKTTYYQDKDGDGWGNSSVTTQACSAPSGYVSKGGDCDDTRASVNPGATEVCNGIDDDCDTQIDENVKTTWYRDADGDGYGSSSTTTQACSQPSGYVAVGGDCNDSNAAINPGAAEICDSLDNDCDGQVDENVKITYYRDADGDGYGTSSTTTQACSQPTGYVTNNLDCNDANAAINPAAIEVCNAIDDDCDGVADDSLTCPDTDNDGDGYTENEGDCDDTNPSNRPVTVDGANTGAEDGTYDKPYNTIQEGINAATTACPLVLVRAYTYRERIDFKGKAITVQSIDGAASTIIDGSAGGTVVTFKTAEKSTSVLDGFTVQNGRAAKGGGMAITGTSTAAVSPTIVNNVFKSNVATGAGGGAIYVTQGTPTIQGNTFSGNTGPTSASVVGVVAGGAILLETNAAATILQNDFTANAHLSGGAIGIRSAGAPVVKLNQFSANTAKDSSSSKLSSGGAIYVNASKPVFTDNVFEDNTSQQAGGAVYIIGTTTSDTLVTMINNSFSGNQAGNVTVSNDTGGLGGAIFGAKANLVLEECDFDLNAAGIYGGAIYLKDQSTVDITVSSFALNLTANTADTGGGAGGAVYIAASKGTLEGNLFQNNSSGLNGGAMILTSSSNVELIDNVFAGNVATSNPNGRGQAGALFVDASTSVMQGNEFEINAANEGGGALVLQAASVQILQNRFFKNTARSKGGAIWVVPTSSEVTPSIVNNLFQGNKVTNTSGQGGAVHINTRSTSGGIARADLINNVLAENEALSQGAGLYVGADSAGKVLNNIFYANKTREGIYVSTTGTVPTLQYNDSFANPFNYGGRQLDATNLQLEPQFQAFTADLADNDDFHLKTTSPVINKGSPDPAYKDVDGTTNDMGAYGGPTGSW